MALRQARSCRGQGQPSAHFSHSNSFDTTLHLARESRFHGKDGIIHYTIARSLRRLFIFFPALFALGVLATGQSRLIFPRLSSEENALTGIAVLNPGDATATVTFAAYDDQGLVIESANFRNPAEITIGPGRQFADVTANLFGILPLETIGWVEASSSASDLTGFFLYLDFPDFVFFDGADLPQADTQLVFPEIRLTGNFLTEINLVNPETETATVLLSLAGGETPLSAAPLEIPARGVLRASLDELFAGEEQEPLGSGGTLPENAVLRVVSTEALAGAAFVTQLDGDLLGINGVPADEQLDQLYFPQFATGEIIRTELALDNLSTQDTLLTLTAHREDGTLFGPGEVSTNPVSMTLKAGGVVRLDLAQTFGFIGNEVREGWLEVASSSAVLQGALSYSLPGSGSLAAVASSPQGSLRAAFSHLATDQGFFTGLALLNPAALTVDVRIVAIAASGEVLGSATRTMAPGERISQLLGVDLIAAAAGQSGGVVFVRSSAPIFLTSLFGRVAGSGVLANIPAQPVPVGYRPDQEIPQARVNPSLASVEPEGSLSFALQLDGAMSPEWRVNGIAGGNQQVGSISLEGDFLAPSAPPTQQPLSITARVADQEASASVDVVSRQVLAEGLGEVQSVAYLEGAARLFVAELAIGPSGPVPASEMPQQSAGSLILDVTEGDHQQIVFLPGEDISKILAYPRELGNESLLAAGRASGQIYRLDVGESNDPVVVASGLNTPYAMALDPETGDLIVAEADSLSRVGSDQLQSTGVSPQGSSETDSLLEEVSPRGVVVDSCSGDILFSDADERAVLRLSRRTGEVTLVVTLTDPTQLLGTLRRGVSCPDGFHLLVAEPALGQVTRSLPEQGFSSVYALTPGVQDVAFLPAGPLSDSEGFLVAEQSGAGGTIELLSVPQTYAAEAPNPPDLSPCIVRALIREAALENQIRQLPEIGPVAPITCELAGNVSTLDARNLGISELTGMGSFEGLQDLVLLTNGIDDLSPLAGLKLLERLIVANNQVADLAPLRRLTNLETLSLGNNQIVDLSPLADLLLLDTLLLDINEVADLSPLAGLNNLRSLQVAANQVSDLSPLSGLVSLSILGLSNNQISDLSPLSGLANLSQLSATRNLITDLSPLAGLPQLRSLELSGNQISDLSSLAGVTTLESLRLNDGQISDLGPLAGLTAIKTLSLTNNQISDISALLANTGWGNGDGLFLIDNLLDLGDCDDLNELEARGVSVFADPDCP